MRGSTKRICLLAALVTLTAMAPATQAVRIADFGESLPDSVHGYGMAVVDDTAYLVGGGRGGTYLDEIVEVPPDGAPSVVGELPAKLKEPAVAAADGTVYIFGGASQSADGGVPTTESTIYEFDPQTGEVNQLLNAQLPEAVSSASAVEVDGAIYILGGLEIASTQDGATLDFKRTIARFDPSTNDVTELSPKLPTGRAQMAEVRHGSTILLFGGHAESGADACPENKNTCFLDDVVRFSPGASSVGQIGELPERVRWSSATMYEDTVYLLGGCKANCRGFQGSAQIVTIDPDNGNAERIPVTMPHKGGRNSAFTLDKHAIVPGGVKSTGDSSTDHSDVVRVELGATRPWAPRNLTATSVDGSIELDFDEPPYDGGSPITGYVVMRAQGAHEPVRMDKITDTSYVDTNATPGKSYTYQVRAENRIDLSITSGEATATATSPPGPVDVLAQGGNEKLVLQWSAPEDTGGQNITRYRVFAYKEGTNPSFEDCNSPACWGKVSPDTHRVTVKNAQDAPVENGQSYEVRVQARNADGWGDLADAKTVTAKPVPDEPKNPRAQRTMHEGKQAVNVTWDAPSGPAADTYVVYRGLSLDELSEIATTTDLQFTDTGEIPNGKRVYYAIAARADGAEGPLSKAPSIVFAQAPETVRDLAARWVGGVARVTWTEPADSGGRPIQHYQVASTRGQIDPADANATIHNVNKLVFEDGDPPRGTTIVYHVRAKTTAGESAWNTTQIRVPKTQDTVAPTSQIAAHPTTTKVGSRVIFDASGSTDDEGVVAYNFSFDDGTSTGWRSDPRVTHTYDQAGIYNASVNVRDVSGLEDRSPSEIQIAVGPAPDDEPDDGGFQDGGTNESDGSNSTPLGWAPLAALMLAGLARSRRD